MARDLTYALKRLVSTWLMALIVISGLLAVFGFGPALEPTLFPVLRDQIPRVISIENNRIAFELKVYKARPCHLEEASWSLKQGDRVTEVKVFREDGSIVDDSSNLPVGWLEIGPFFFEVPPRFPSPDEVYGVLYYDCHAGWLTQQILGPVRLQ